MMTEPVLRVSGITKAFPGVKALTNVDLTLWPGKLTALLGENGAGKSTLMNIVAGVLPPDSGTIYINEEEVSFSNTKAAMGAGIAMIYQELNLIDELTIAQNIFLGREPKNKLGFIDESRMDKLASEILADLELQISPSTQLKQLRVGQRQIVEIAKAISCEAKVLIMDEPTSALSNSEVEVLYRIVDKLKRDGVAIAYITHKMEELTRIGDDAVVLRDGCLIGHGNISDFSRDQIIAMMVGREGKSYPERSASHTGEEILRLQGISLSHPNNKESFIVNNLNLSLHKGEVLGVFGLMGAGRTELLECLFGLHPKQVSGEFYVNGKKVTIKSPRDAISLGIALAPEDRKHEGLVLGMSVLENTTLATLPDHERSFMVNAKLEHKTVEKAIARFGIKTPSASQLIRNLSGGNQQKVILGKWLETNPSILLLDEPTRGIDVGAKAEIYALIHEMSKDGLSVIVVSSELPEIMALSDRIAVLSEGHLTGVFNRDTATEEIILNAALPKSGS